MSAAVPTYCKEHMRWKPFLLISLSALLLFASWFVPITSNWWQALDVWLFHWLNATVANQPIVQIFWALANVKLTDLFGALFMIAFTLIYVFDAEAKEAKFRLAQLFYAILWFEIGIASVKGIIFKCLVALHFLRESPTLVFPDCFMLSDVVPWLNVKDHSHWSFPGDHAFIVLQWAGFISFYCGWRLGLLAYLSSLLFIFPRLIGGAHWCTDILLGSLPLSLIFVAWGCYTPIYPFMMKYLERFSGFLLSKTRSLYKLEPVPLNAQKEY